MARITAEQALARIQPKRAKGIKTKSTTKPLLLINTIGNGEDDDLFIFANDRGGIITPADDTLPAILGTWEGSSNDIPPALMDWMQEYVAEVDWWLRVGQELPEEGNATEDNRITIDPLLKTKWGLGTPYNKNLVFEDKSTLVGCAAIAAGLIIYYWGTKGFHRGCTATPAYTTLTNGYTVKALPSTITFDYKNLTATKPTTDKSKEAVAKLLEYVGKAMYSDYKPNSTTVYTDKIVPALKENFRMGDVKLVNSSTVSEQRFSDIVYDELKLGRPVILFGTGTNGGHFFVCDGYDASTGLFHMNWGWNGSYNGWFAMSALTPTTKNYNSRKRAYIGIAPLYKAGDANKDGEVNITDVTATVNSINSGKYNEGSDINYDGLVTVTDVELLVDVILGRREL